MAYCSACGKQLTPEAAFCSGCGKSAVLVAERNLRPGPLPEPLPLLIYPHAGPAAPLPARPPALFWKDLVPSAWQAAAAFGGLLLIATALAGVSDAVIQDAGEHGDLGDWLSFGMLLISLGAGGSAEGKLTSELASGTASLHAMPFLMTVLLLLPIVLSARRTERRWPATTTVAHLARAGTHAVVLAALIGFGGFLATATSRIDEVRVVVGPTPASTALTTFVIVGAASFLARATVSRMPFLAVVRGSLAAVLLVSRFWLSLLMVALLAAPLLVLTDVEPAAILTGVLVALPAGALALAGVPVSGEVSAGLTGLAAWFSRDSLGGEQEGNWGLVTDPSRWTLLLLAPVLVLSLVVVRHTVGHPPAAWRNRLHGAAIAGTAAAFAASFFVLALAQRLSVNAAADGGVAGGSFDLLAGPSLAGSVLAGLLWGGLAGLLLRWAPSFALAMPRLTRLTGRVDPSWKEILGGRAAVPSGVLSPRVARWVAVAAAVGVFLAGAAVGVQAVIGAVVYSPGKAALAYLQAVSSGDAERARALLESPPTDSTMLTGAVLRADGVQRPERIRALSTTKDGDDAAVEVAFSLGGTEHRMTLALHADPDKPRSGLFPDWRISSLLGTVQNPYTYDDYASSVAGRVITDETGLFPGRYPVTVSDPGALYAWTPVNVAVLGEPTGFDPPDATLSAEGRSRVADAVLQELEDCASDSYGYDCPFDAYDVPSYLTAGESVRFRLETKPYIDVKMRGDAIIAEVTGAVAYTETMYSGPDEVGTIPLSVTATIDTAGGNLAVSFG